MKKTKVLFVCLGNICRSPLAEAIFKHKISEKGINHRFEADSCGTAHYHVGDTPDPRTIANAKRNRVSIDHIGQQLSLKLIQENDFIVAMDKSNYQNILRLAGAQMYREKVSMMRSYEAIRGDENVPDPYYGDERDFQQVFEILDHAIDSFIQYLEKEIKV